MSTGRGPAMRCPANSETVMAQARICMAADVSALAMTPDLGAQIRGVDLSAPISDACFRRILEIFHRYCVVFLRDQHLEPQHLMRFAARFGELETPSSVENVLPGMPQVRVVGRQLGEAGIGGLIRDGTHWHSDFSFRPAPVAATLTYALECPANVYRTEFSNMYSALDALPLDKRLFVERLRAVHDRSFRYSDRYPSRPPLTPDEIASAPPAEHPLVRLHPATRRKALYLAKDVVSHVQGMQADESRKLIDELEAYATQPRFSYEHRWRQGDLVICDNRCTVHREAAYDSGSNRMLHRIWIKGEIPVAA